jgi:hypothetical protein
MFSCDIYPLRELNGGRFIVNSWLSGVEGLALAAKKYGAESHFFIQATSFPSGGGLLFPAMTEADLRFQFFTNMAFGIRNFTYFTYRDSREPGFGESMVSGTVSCRKHALYDSAKAVNAEMKALQNIYFSFSWNGTLPVIGTENAAGSNPNFDGLSAPLQRIPCVKAVAASRDTLIGEFYDQDGNSGLTVVNFTNPCEGLTDTVKFEFASAKKAAVYAGGKEKVYTLQGGKLELKLEPGHGAFVIPVA